MKYENELCFVYYVDANVGYQGSGWHLIHIASNMFLFNSISEQGRKAFEGNRKDAERFIKDKISEGFCYKKN